MDNPYASPAEGQTAALVKSRVLRVAGLTVCFLLGGVSSVFGVFIFVMVIIESAPEPAAAAIASVVGPLLYILGFGAAWLLAGVLLALNRRAWGWAAVAVGISIPVALTWLVGL